ncbi:MAG: class I SAM-dependent RNA methyltransferase, partial [Bdellovibrionales bacterium]|nr:class I SAM-dependent RNA methyltransferase [Bdellovibrionales bacterium]
EMIEPSPHRVEPPCPVFGQCGGCKFQHISSSEQLSQKNKYIEKALAGLEKEALFPIQASPRPYFYRNRIQVHVHGSEIGFLKPKSNDLVPIEGCQIAERPIHEFLKGKDGRKKIFDLNAKKVEVSLDLSESVQVRPVSKEPTEGLFSQVNRFQNENLVSQILAWSRAAHSESPYQRVLDLYAGAGNLTFPLYEALKLPTDAIELSQALVRQGKALREPDQKINFVCSDVKAYLKHFSFSPISQSLLVVSDPPREGLNDLVISSLSKIQPQTLIHVGCDLMNFSRDLRKLSAQGFKVREIRS